MSPWDGDSGGHGGGERRALTKHILSFSTFQPYWRINRSGRVETRHRRELIFLFVTRPDSRVLGF